MESQRGPHAHTKNKETPYTLDIPKRIQNTTIIINNAVAYTKTRKVDTPRQQ